MKQISGERLQDHWSSGCISFAEVRVSGRTLQLRLKITNYYVNKMNVLELLLHSILSRLNKVSYC